MAKRIRSCLSLAIILSLILCAFQWSARIAFSADTNKSEDITVIECEDIQYVGAQSVEFHYDGKELRLVGISNNNTELVIARIKPEKEVIGRVDDYNCDGDTVSITEKWAFKSVYITQVCKWNGKTLRQIKTAITDPSSDAIDSALEEALKGNLAEAISSPQGVMYPWNYLGCGTVEEFLEKGHKASLAIQKTKGFKQAATALGKEPEVYSRREKR